MEKHKKFTRAEVQSWPEGHKRCRTCWTVLPLSDFHNHSSGLMEKYHTCKTCRMPDSKAGWQTRTFEQTMLASSKFRAKKNKIRHTITLEDIVIPEICPILKEPIVLERGHEMAPSLDRVTPVLGYTPNNILVMSKRANFLKNNMNIDECFMLWRWFNHEYPSHGQGHEFRKPIPGFEWSDKMVQFFTERGMILQDDNSWSTI